MLCNGTIFLYCFILHPFVHQPNNWAKWILCERKRKTDRHNEQDGVNWQPRQPNSYSKFVSIRGTEQEKNKKNGSDSTWQEWQKWRLFFLVRIAVIAMAQKWKHPKPTMMCVRVCVFHLWSMRMQFAAHIKFRPKNKTISMLFERQMECDERTKRSIKFTSKTRRGEKSL